MLFGASAPAAKLLLPSSGPLMLAGLLYLGAGLALLAAVPFRKRSGEAPLTRRDAPVLLGMVMSGGMLGPILLMLGLQRIGAVPASLLLNLEAPFTIALAVLLFGDHLGRRAAAGAALVVVAAGALAWRGPGLHLEIVGAAAVAGACICWALDNNLSQRVSLKDPRLVVIAKALPAGAFSVVVALASGERVPSPWTCAGALATGALGYGASIALHLLAVRKIGAARQAAIFATGPFVGAVLAVPILGEHLRPADGAVALAMGLGLWAIFQETHSHRHVHEPLVHEHAHVHDEHHQHPHPGPVTEPHSHPHRHEGVVHDHPHLPDVHHRHGHRR